MRKELQAKIDNFNKLSKAEKRMAIAQDVIQQLKCKKYIAAQSGYVGKLPDGDIQKNFSKIKKCKVCALGSCILSIAKFKDHISSKDVIGLQYKDTSNKAIEELLSLFSKEQLALIENAFEQTINIGISNSLVPNQYSDKFFSAEGFGYSYSDPEDRLIAIMKNIIKNRGIFKP